MEKLVERDAAPRNPLVAAPSLAVQFFLIPLTVVAITVAIYVGFRSLLTDSRTAENYLTEVRTGGSERRWPAAYELSRLMADPAERRNPVLASALVDAFVRAKEDDPRVRRYLALAIGRLEPPLPKAAIDALSRSLQEPEPHYSPDWFSRVAGATESEAGEARITTIWALGSSGDPAVVPTVEPFYRSADAGVRKMVVYALGALPGDAQLATLSEAVRDPEADVRWNAAVALARHGSQEGVGIIGQMLDRPYLERTIKREARPEADIDPVAEVMISGLRAAATLKAPALRAPVTALSQQDRSVKVRQAALEALREIG